MGFVIRVMGHGVTQLSGIVILMQPSSQLSTPTTRKQALSPMPRPPTTCYVSSAEHFFALEAKPTEVEVRKAEEEAAAAADPLLLAAHAKLVNKKRKRRGKTKACKQQGHEDADSGSQEHEDADSGSQGKGGEGAAAEVEAEVEGAQTEEEEAAASINRSAGFIGFVPGEDEGLHKPSIHEVKCLGVMIKGLSDIQASQVTMNWLFKRPAEAKEHIATIVAASQHCLTLEVDLPWCGPKSNYLLGNKDTIAQDLNKKCTLDVYCNDYQEHHNVAHDQVRIANSVRNRRGGLRAAE